MPWTPTHLISELQLLTPLSESIPQLLQAWEKAKEYLPYAPHKICHPQLPNNAFPLLPNSQNLPSKLASSSLTCTTENGASCAVTSTEMLPPKAFSYGDTLPAGLFNLCEAIS